VFINQPACDEAARQFSPLFFFSCALQWLCAGLVWGWAAQDAAAPLYGLYCDAVDDAPAAGVGVPATGSLAAAAAEGDGESWTEPAGWAHPLLLPSPLPRSGAPPSATERAAFMRLPPHLQHSGRCSPVHTLRRLDAIAAAAAPGALPPTLVPELTTLLRRLLAAHRTRQAAQAATAGDLVSAMRGRPEGLCVPLTCGHNAAWSRAEVGMVARAIVAAVGPLEE
jgi:hypothetical protein